MRRTRFTLLTSSDSISLCCRTGHDPFPLELQEYANKTAIPTMDAGTTAARRMPEGYLLGLLLP